MDLLPTEDKYFVDLESCNNDDSLDDELHFLKTKTAREGREIQVYNSKTYARLVSGCVVLNSTHDKLLMISSSKHIDNWVIPKGGIEYDEVGNFKLTARRETWEEAGVLGKILKKLPVVEDHRFLKSDNVDKTFKNIDLHINGSKIPRSEFHFYEMELTELCNEWPEGNKRKRKWCTYEEAKHELIKSNRPELIEALNDSRIAKDCVKIKLDEHSNQLLDAQPETDDY
ncbi:hypothetical protein CANARDRAFT_173903 [[Candida] arabinofermentans NRRL YB-2248]|uniref:Nudix hydrolase domain-containing protein n=1 Tax=[Candida] arabinofermentans NRRL YB-2248 TaxID=983967 RepID=A0A1E4T8F3_9ASCO|nr:hypothetical protein CANARDRAFT_173903 [[Candida] arabinofermentans NRRL YB-2248]